MSLQSVSSTLIMKLIAILGHSVVDLGQLLQETFDLVRASIENVIGRDEQRLLVVITG